MCERNKHTHTYIYIYIYIYVYIYIYARYIYPCCNQVWINCVCVCVCVASVCSVCMCVCVRDGEFASMLQPGLDQLQTSFHWSDLQASVAFSDPTSQMW